MEQKENMTDNLSGPPTGGSGVRQPFEKAPGEFSLKEEMYRSRITELENENKNLRQNVKYNHPVVHWTDSDKIKQSKRYREGWIKAHTDAVMKYRMEELKNYTLPTHAEMQKYETSVMAHIEHMPLEIQSAILTNLTRYVHMKIELKSKKECGVG